MLLTRWVVSQVFPTWEEAVSVQLVAGANDRPTCQLHGEVSGRTVHVRVEERSIIPEGATTAGSGGGAATVGAHMRLFLPEVCDVHVAVSCDGVAGEGGNEPAVTTVTLWDKLVGSAVISNPAGSVIVNKIRCALCSSHPLCWLSCLIPWVSSCFFVRTC